MPDGGGPAGVAERAAAAAVRHGALLPARAGVTGTVDLAVTGTTGGDTHVLLSFADGRVVAASVGHPSRDADVTLTLPIAEAADLAAGVTTPSVAFMRGRMKVAGDNRLLLGVLATTAEWTTRWQPYFEDVM